MVEEAPEVTFSYVYAGRMCPRCYAIHIAANCAEPGTISLPTHCNQRNSRHFPCGAGLHPISPKVIKKLLAALLDGDQEDIVDLARKIA